MKKGKAAGPSGVVVEIIAAGGNLTVKWMTVQLNNIIEEGRTPTDWTKSTLIPLYKGKGNMLQCELYKANKRRPNYWSNHIDAIKVYFLKFGHF